MKYLTSKKILTLCFAICMIIVLCAGICMANSTIDTAFAEEASSDMIVMENGIEITFDYQNGVIAGPMWADIGRPIPTPPIMPYLFGYTFIGFFDDPVGGNRYTNDDMTSARNCDFDKDTTLYAHWIPIKLDIIYFGVDSENNPNPEYFTIEQIQNEPLVFAQPLDCGQAFYCEWIPSEINMDNWDKIGMIEAIYHPIPLWENIVIENGIIQYHIYSESQFLDLNNENVEMGENVYFYLEADLDFSGYENACITRQFVGIFDRQGHTIVGIDFEYGSTAQNSEIFTYHTENMKINKIKLGTLECDTEILKNNAKRKTDKSFIEDIKD